MLRFNKPLGNVALGEVRQWANSCEDDGGRLYALPLVDAYEELRAEIERLRALLRRLFEWDHMASAADGPYWRSEIEKVLGQPKDG